jgi:high-affinity Fe2+/Pb2+ permease
LFVAFLSSSSESESDEDDDDEESESAWNPNFLSTGLVVGFALAGTIFFIGFSSSESSSESPSELFLTFVSAV